jgi:Flp pilus assembly protein protease CpaA
VIVSNLVVFLILLDKYITSIRKLKDMWMINVYLVFGLVLIAVGAFIYKFNKLQKTIWDNLQKK